MGAAELELAAAAGMLCAATTVSHAQLMGNGYLAMTIDQGPDMERYQGIVPLQGDDLIAVIAEVSNTFGERHSYFCARPGFAPITPGDRIRADKVFHVSPFQDVGGDYTFSFDLGPGRIAIRILLTHGTEGLVATLGGTRAPMTNRALAAAALRHPFGPLRVLALIYWHALRLKLKGVTYRTKPHPPEQDVTR